MHSSETCEASQADLLIELLLMLYVTEKPLTYTRPNRHRRLASVAVIDNEESVYHIEKGLAIHHNPLHSLTGFVELTCKKSTDSFIETFENWRNYSGTLPNS